jgi:hypothetical protein
MEVFVRNVPNVWKAVRCNSPFYGIEGRGWFVNFHCFTKYLKVAFLRGTSLRPLPSSESKHKDMRYLDIHEDDRLDENLVASWIRQASALPGWVAQRRAGQRVVASLLPISDADCLIRLDIVRAAAPAER